MRQRPGAAPPTVTQSKGKRLPPRHSRFFLSFRRNSLCKNPMGIQRIKPTPPLPCPHLAIPAQAGIQRIKRALRAPSGRSEGAAGSHTLAPPPAAAIARMCAFRALFALDSRLRGNGGFLPCQWEMFSRGSGFSEFLHRLLRGNGGLRIAERLARTGMGGPTIRGRQAAGRRQDPRRA